MRPFHGRLASLAALTLATMPIDARADAPALEKVATIALKGPVGGMDHLAVDSKRGLLFVANTGNNSLDIVDMKTNTLVRQIAGQGHIRGVTYSPEADRVFVGNGTGGVCNVFDAQNFNLVKSVALGEDADNLRFAPASKLIFVARADKEVSVIDATDFSVRSPIEMPPDVGGFAIESKPPRLYVNSKSSNHVYVIDTAKAAVVAKFPVDKHTLFKAGVNSAAALDEANRRLFVGCRKPAALIVMNADTGEIRAGLTIPGNVDDVSYDAANHRIYASCGEGYVALIRQAGPDAYQMRHSDQVATAQGAKTSVFDPSTRRLYVAVPRNAARPDQANPEIWVYQANP